MQQPEIILMIISTIATLVTGGAVPIIITRINKQSAHHKRVGKHRIEIDEADMIMTKYSRLLTRETAEAVHNQRTNGELAAAIVAFDKAYTDLEEKKEAAILKLKQEYE